VSNKKQTKKSIRTNAAAWSVAVPFLLIILARLAAGIYPQSNLWGFNFQGFLPDAFILPLTLIAIIAAVPAVADHIYALSEKGAAFLFPESRTRSLLVHAAIAVAFGICCRMFLVPFAFLGDGVHVARALFRYNTDAGLAYGTLWMEPLSMFVYNTLIKLFVTTASSESGVNITAYTGVFLYTSFVLGAAYIFGILRASAGISDQPVRRLALVASILGCGGILFFFGYVEFYAFLYLFGTFFLLLATREARQPGFPVWSTALFITAILFHLSALIFLPAYAVTVFLWRRGIRGAGVAESGTSTRGALLLAGGFLLTGFAAYLAMNLTGSNAFFIALTSEKGYLALFSLQHFVDGLNNVFLHSPVGLALIIAGVVYRKQLPLRDPRFVIAATSAVSWLALCFSHSAIARDWDVYALLGVSLALAGYFFVEHLADQPAQRYHLAQLVVQPILLVLPWIGLNASFDLSLQRYSAVTETYATLLPPEVTLGHLETLRSAFVTSRNSEGEIMTVVRGLQLKFDRYECYKLTRAFENARSIDPVMLRAAENVLNLIIMQPDSVRTLPVGQTPNGRATSLNDVYVNLAKAVVRLMPAEQRAPLAVSALLPMYEKGLRTFDIASYIGNRYFDAKQYDESLDWYEKALPDSIHADEEQRASVPMIFHGMGIIYAKKGDEQRSLDYFRRAVRSPGIPAMTWSDYGFACYTFARFQEAVYPFSQALRMDSTNINALYCLGKILLLDPAQNAVGRRLLGKYLTLESNSARAADAREIMNKTPEQLRAMRF
jgi:tetratricopeptide (TPR) repeat protein